MTHVLLYLYCWERPRIAGELEQYDGALYCAKEAKLLLVDSDLMY